MATIRHFWDLDVYQLAMQSAMEVFQVSKRFAADERYSLTDQVRRSSRSACANIAEAWRKRRYPKSFISKLSDAEAEAAETQVWLEFALNCGYIQADRMEELDRSYDHIQGKLVRMLTHPDDWTIRRP